MKTRTVWWQFGVILVTLLALAGCRSDSGQGLTGNESAGGDGTVVFDADNDGIPDNEDSCPETINGGVDADADGIDDACDPETSNESDRDSDGISNHSDNCPELANADQANADGDLSGDLCDTDDDGDTVSDAADNCPLLANRNQADLDNDGIGNACDTDTDGDGTADGDDACPLVSGTDPLLCAPSADTDGDGIPNVGPDGTTPLDNCPDTVNPDQEDLDGDGVGNVCDDDTDGDGVNNTGTLTQGGDNCPLTVNPEQADTDGDGIGDACDLVDDSLYACGVSGQPFTPMLTSDADIAAVASEERADCSLSLLGGLLCSVDNPANAVDNDLGNAATLQNTDLLGTSTIRLRVAATTGFAYPASNAVGIAFDEGAQALQADLLGGDLVVRTRLAGVIQEESEAEGVLDLDLLGASGLLNGNSTSFLVFQTDKRFDTVELAFAPSLLSLLNEVNVRAVCASKTDLPAP